MANEPEHPGIQVIVETNQGLVVMQIKATNSLVTQIVLTAEEAETLRGLLQRGIECVSAPGAGGSN